MTTDQLPDPLVPAEVDLRDFQWMPLDVARLRDSGLAATETPERCWAAVLLWCAAWHQLPAASIPNDDVWIAKACGYVARGRVDPAWEQVREGAMRNFVLCSDGRLYHKTLAAKAIESWNAKQAQRARTAAATAAREAKKAARLAEELASRGGQPQRDERPEPPRDDERDGSRDVQRDDPPKAQRNVVDNQSKGPDRTGPDRTLKEEPLADTRGAAASADSPQGAPPASPGRYGAISKALRTQGIQANPHHPRFMALVDAGATANEFLAFADRAKGKADPFAYVLGAVEGERSRAKAMQGQLHTGDMPGEQAEVLWHETAGGIKAMGEKLGRPYTREDECQPFGAYKQAVMALHRQQGVTA